MKLDVLAFGAHPDDVELACSGTLIKLVKSGKKVGIIDLTKGEMGTRGTAEIREKEAMTSAELMGVSVRENLDLGDAWFEIDKANKLAVIEAIRAHRPEIIFINAREDRHVDHPRGAELVKQAAFLSGLTKIETSRAGQQQEPFRPKHIFHYIQYHHYTPDFVVDITNEFELKMQAILTFKSQFYDPHNKEPMTLIASEGFLGYVEARAREFGSVIETKYGEGFNTINPLEFDPSDLL